MARTKTKRKVTISTTGTIYYDQKFKDPAYDDAMRILSSFKKEGGAGPVRTLKEMSAAEIAALEAQYGCRVARA